ncbi:type I-F CRISPR-associated endoribonuclease Cas6/Csy4 [Enterobacteriaceae bacterium YMB-R22]|jgi:CRISPR-associated endonuclease Csy4|uniref:type I-F CRISPR-associated endoribonuclease Cas6/Csy4 n=1 Tax=Tenebrionicola larvae TaxID=2815733 RepID=UPI002012F047|nr:type I-F CRISPR-associated endoribonuclease Cas6/Csy4 [Tenebrionicola larvae]MBV4411370.1 type I-F CRISPR-associated endoribonuclease Cas6/Csy4 [Tenebrionicola larvae]
MNSYLNIRVLRDPEFSTEALMAALFAKLHRALGARGRGDIGVSFPEYSRTPGSVLRLHGTAVALGELEATRWRAGLGDYCHVTDIALVPAGNRWRTVRRVQVKSSPARLLSRSVRKGWLSEAQAQERLASAQPQQSDQPYLNLKSLSSGQHFRLFICHGELLSAPVAGRFSSYGLSARATIPWF